MKALTPPILIRATLLGALVLLVVSSELPAGIDGNNNQQSDVWEMVYGARNLAGTGDADGDLFSNQLESAAGTNPLDARSYPSQTLDLTEQGAAVVGWPSLPGKFYEVEYGPSLTGSSWQILATERGTGGRFEVEVSLAGLPKAFFRVRTGDLDSDLDGVFDWEELAVGFDPFNAATGRYFWEATRDWETGPYRSADYNRIVEGMNTPSVVNVGVVESEATVGWPDPAVVAIRRAGGLGALTVPITITSTAVPGTDYTTDSTTTVTIPAGASEALVQFTPASTAAFTANRTITVSAGTSALYTLGTPSAQTITLKPRLPGNRPSEKAAARFLVQAAFGATPVEIARVQALGFEGWIDDQFSRPINWHQPDMEAIDQQVVADNPEDPEARAYGHDYPVTWWNQAMKTGNTADPLRQRVAFALSQIAVISDRVDVIGFYPVAMANYYDMLLKNAFGSYRTFLYDVTLHPCMGAYLSHLRNAREDPENNLFPDENYAREIMQLFSIGLWELNPDGSKKLGPGGQPIPTYNNATIQNFAKVFTGLTLKKAGGNPSPDVRTADWYFWTEEENYAVNMEMWDRENWVYRADREWITTHEFYHDRSAKTLLSGVTLPANQRGLKDISDAIDNLFQHPNTGPFVCRQLIQRFVTSNPSPGYIQRVANVFTANKANPQQMRLVIKAILLDPEARDPLMMADEKFGKQREPYLRIANLGKAFNAAAANGKFELRYLDYATSQRPLNSPSVFNFYLPDYQPPGVMAERGLYGPEFQITNDITALSNANYAYSSVVGWREWDGAPTANFYPGDLNIWGSNYDEADPRHDTDLVIPDYTTEIALASDPDRLIQRLNLLLTYGNLSTTQHRIIREALERITLDTHGPDGYESDYLRTRVETAVYLIITSPEFCILK